MVCDEERVHPAIEVKLRGLITFTRGSVLVPEIGFKLVYSKEKSYQSAWDSGPFRNNEKN